MTRLSIAPASADDARIGGFLDRQKRRVDAMPPGMCPLAQQLTLLEEGALQTCGKCVPCRDGLPQLAEMLRHLVDCQADAAEVERMRSLAEMVRDTSDCAIGYEAAGALLEGLDTFAAEVESHVSKHACQRGVGQSVPCETFCPAHVNVPAYIALVAAGDNAGAVQMIRKDNPFPTACGLVCEHPCEKRCRRTLIDAPLNIRGIKEYACEHARADQVPVPERQPSTGRRVAIVGGGPSGMTCAYFAALMGHDVDVFESRKQLGGMMRYGIPAYRFPRERLDEDIRGILAVGGITVITGLSSGAMLKGLFGGALGMLLSTVGYSTLTGEPRFVIHEALNGGIALVPALIGLFAVPQIIDLMADSHVLLEKLTFKPQKGMLRQVIKAHRRYLRTLGIGSLIGTIIGVIPGAGGQVAGLMSYDQTKKFDKNPDRFGTGDPEGVCAAESANNATVAPAMIPLLTLSIPGSPTAAVLLGGLLIHGLFPGPDLFTEKADITYTFISGLLLAQFFMCFFGLLASRYSHLVANAPNYMMFAAVMILCVFGSYCVQNSYEDVILMFILGVLMFVLAKFGFPSAPIVLGIILGPIAEENFLRGKMIADTDVGVFSYFFTGGLNLALIALCLLSLIWGIYSEVKYMRNHSRKAAAAN